MDRVKNGSIMTQHFIVYKASSHGFSQLSPEVGIFVPTLYVKKKKKMELGTY